MDIRYLEFMYHLSNIRQMRFTSFVIGNFLKKNPSYKGKLT